MAKVSSIESHKLRERRVAVSEQRQAGEGERIELAKRRERNKESTLAHRQQHSMRKHTNEERRIALAEQRQAYRERVSSEQGRGSFPPSHLSIPKPSTGTDVDSARAQKVIAISWLFGVAVISWQEVKINGRPPDPDKFVGWAAVYMILDVVGGLITWPFSEVLGVGFVIGLLLFRKPKRTVTPGSGEGVVAGSGEKPGQSDPNLGLTEKYGTGQWQPDPFDPAHLWQWTHFPTWNEMAGPGSTAAASRAKAGQPPGASPPWRWSGSQGGWVDTSKFPQGNPLYDPSAAPRNLPGK